MIRTERSFSFNDQAHVISIGFSSTSNPGQNVHLNSDSHLYMNNFISYKDMFQI